MDRYHFNIRLNNLRYNHAGSKAVEDCKAILLNSGFKDIEVAFVKKTYLMPLNFIKLFYMLGYYNLKIKPGSLILVQYPLLGINRFFKYFVGLLKAKKCRFVCLIHDLDSIRTDTPDGSIIKREIAILNNYDTVIAHNETMGNWLGSNGYNGKVVTMQLFDYLTDAMPNKVSDSNSNNQVAFAGNLGRGEFLRHLKDIPDINFNLYGPNPDESLVQGSTNLKWNGVFSPDDIARHLQGSFGLVWDGTSIEQCSGVMGKYLQYNTPHKVSLYLVSGLPVIVPDTSAIAAFVRSNNLGIVVNSLKDLKQDISQVTEDSYKEMINNAQAISVKLKAGHYLKNAVKQVI